MSAARAFLLGAQLRRTSLRAARALALIGLGLCALGWLRAELDRQELEAEIAVLRVHRIDLENDARDARGALRGCKGTLRGAAVRLGLHEDALTLAGGAR